MVALGNRRALKNFSVLKPIAYILAIGACTREKKKHRVFRVSAFSSAKLSFQLDSMYVVVFLEVIFLL